jgi:phage baseplate assembly protein W
MINPRLLLGTGWNFPVAPDPEARRLLYVSGPDKVRQSIWIILDTEPGERLMRPSFGCGLRRYLMKPNTAATRALIESDVQLALSLFEPRIVLQSVQVDPGDDPSLVLIRISYIHTADRRPDSIVYPFYLETGAAVATA